MNYILKNKIISVLKSIFVILIGIFLSILILEVFLHCFGYVKTHWNKFTNIKTKQPDELRILALGESMTNSGINPYPKQLQEILSNNPKIFKKIKVINGGVPGSASRDIINNLESYLDQYNPDIVVLMTGINSDQIVNYDQWANIKKEDKTNNIKSIKLIKYFYQNIKSKQRIIINIPNISNVQAIEPNNVDDIIQFITKNIDNLQDVSLLPLLPEDSQKVSSYEKSLLDKIEFSSNKDIDCMELSNYYVGNNQRKKSTELALKAISFNPNNSNAYQRLSDIQTLSKEYRVRLIQKAIETNPNNVFAYSALGEVYRIYGEQEKRINVYILGVSKVPNSFDLLYEIGKYYYSQENYIESEKYLQEALNNADKNNGINSNIYQILANIYRKQNRNNEAEKALGMATQSSDVLENNLPIIAEILKKKGVKLIAMQYPLRDVNILKNILKDYDASFVDNKVTFEQAINEKGVDNIFLDMFAGDFGHCTPEGNRIMAENVASIIIEEYFNQ